MRICLDSKPIDGALHVTTAITIRLVNDLPDDYIHGGKHSLESKLLRAKETIVSIMSHALRIILYEPEIPPNTGNLIRLCANTGVQLHLIEPLGFSMDTKALRRAGLDYHESAAVQIHASFEACLASMQLDTEAQRIFALSTRGKVAYSEPDYQAGDILLFGPETRGLPQHVLEDRRIQNTLRIPMKKNSRSLNLSNAAAIVTFEALRQIGFPELR